MKNKIILEELVNPLTNLELVTEGDLEWEGSTVIKSTEIDMNFLVHTYEDRYDLFHYRWDDEEEMVVTSFVESYTDVFNLVRDMVMDVDYMKRQNRYLSLIEDGLSVEDAVKMVFA